MNFALLDEQVSFSSRAEYSSLTWKVYQICRRLNLRVQQYTEVKEDGFVTEKSEDEFIADGLGCGNFR